jgi:hypothetical protein
MDPAWSDAVEWKADTFVRAALPECQWTQRGVHKLCARKMNFADFSFVSTDALLRLPVLFM